MRDRGCDAQLIARDKGKGPITPDNVDTPTDDELSSGSSLSLNLSWQRTKSRKRPSPYPTFKDAVSGASRRARREAGRR